MIRLLGCSVLLCLLLIAWPATATSCPFCAGQGETLVSDATMADMILFGSLKNPTQAKGGDDFDGTTELHIEVIDKEHPSIKDKKVVILPRYLPSIGGANDRFLVYCTIFKGKIDP